jgi:hypothetical protein
VAQIIQHPLEVLENEGIILHHEDHGHQDNV